MAIPTSEVGVDGWRLRTTIRKALSSRAWYVWCSICFSLRCLMTFRYASESLVSIFRFFEVDLNEKLLVPIRSIRSVRSLIKLSILLTKIGGGAGIGWTSSVSILYDVGWVGADWFKASSVAIVAGEIGVNLFSVTNWICCFFLTF